MQLHTGNFSQFSIKDSCFIVLNAPGRFLG